MLMIFLAYLEIDSGNQIGGRKELKQHYTNQQYDEAAYSELF